MSIDEVHEILNDYLIIYQNGDGTTSKAIPQNKLSEISNRIGDKQ